ncbi:MAG TPA: D-alanyl-D-alanine carboxypeptidase [Clostridiaceae bacterium]|nr:D-alanyl-D-alanine carboxypeptidase [Clostridiaceae bacterium]
MRKSLFIIFILVLFAATNLQVYASPKTDAKAAILVEVNTGKILYAENPTAELYPASTTKIMTAILALEKGSLDQVMTASKEAVYDIGPDGMHVGIKPGESYTLDVLLNAMLVKSANEAANIIAENISPTRKEFIELMNARAKELGCTNTNFKNANGMHDDNHYSSALDLSIIARHALTLPKFREVVSQKYYNMPSAGNPDEKIYLESTNLLLNETSECFTRVTGIKTGYTDPAGFNLVASAVDNSNLELLAVILGAKTREDSFKFGKELLEYGYKNFAVQNIIEANHVVRTVNVLDAEGSPELELVASKEIKALLPLDKSLWNIEKEISVKNPVNAPVKAGDVIGSVIYKADGSEIGRSDLIASRSVSKIIPEVTEQAADIIEITNTDNQTGYSRYVVLFAICLAVIVLLFALIRTLRKRRIRRFRRIYWR